MSRINQLEKVLKAINSSGSIEGIDLENLNKEERDLLLKLYEEGMVEESITFLAGLDTTKDWNAIKKQLNTPIKSFRRIGKTSFKYAAVMLVCSVLAIVFTKSLATDRNKEVPENAVTLTIGNDDIRVITNDEEQTILNGSGEVIGSQQGNRITYSSEAKQDVLVYNELNIPHGNVFEVQLSDGSLVHLNAGSKLRYPVKFLKGHKRKVFIEGEGYFQVAEDKEHPFIVYADDVAVEVLGTAFNVASYTDNKVIETVLVEGSVQLKTQSNAGKELKLQPGFMASWNKADYSLNVKEVPTENYTGWINGELIFRDIPFKDMEKRLERAFDVQIENNNLMLAEKILNARFNKEVENIEVVLKAINAIYPFSYKISGKQIVIK
ncbi:FecR family protein [Arenibacter nanhaiticus]|uniref:FecR family protein n=1 Tax=Arenibacter nanhaiticus TaxID=558155 RepID=A0A1M6C2Z0_9FLAO|nr:FecR domain-containing protein [Arenibacter nanhaiticus]SHI55134.1 FecR family protein [Arenibacter nanhaiticus]